MTYAGNKVDIDFINRVKAIPALRERFESILDIVENTSGNFETADETEKQAIIEIRKLENEVLGSWGKKQAEQKAKEFLATDKPQKKTVKKK